MDIHHSISLSPPLTPHSCHSSHSPGKGGLCKVIYPNGRLFNFIIMKPSCPYCTMQLAHRHGHKYLQYTTLGDVLCIIHFSTLYSSCSFCKLDQNEIMIEVKWFMDRIYRAQLFAHITKVKEICVKPVQFPSNSVLGKTMLICPFAL